MHRDKAGHVSIFSKTIKNSQLQLCGPPGNFQIKLHPGVIWDGASHNCQGGEGGVKDSVLAHVHKVRNEYPFLK